MSKNVEDWEDEDEKTEKRLPLIILIALLVIGLCVVALYWVTKDNRTGPSAHKIVGALGASKPMTNQELEDFLTDSTREKPTDQRISEFENYAGKPFLDSLPSYLDPRKPILGVYGVNMKVDPLIQKVYEPREVATISTSGLITINELWKIFEESGLHENALDSKNIFYAHVATDKMLDAKLWNTMAKLSGALGGEKNAWAGGDGCFLNALGGAGANGIMLCTTGKDPIGKGEWRMMINAPSIDWAGTTDEQGAMKMTFVRQVFMPGKAKGTTVIASTPISLFMERSTESIGAPYPWVATSIIYGDTLTQTVQGTVDNL